MSVEHNQMIYFMLNSTIIIIIAHRTLLSVIWQPGWKESSGRMDTHICISECLLCSPAIATLIIGYQFSSVIQSCLTLCDPMDCSMPGLSVHHQLPEHPTILFSVIPFPSCLQSFPASGSFPMSQFSASGGQSIGVSASASVLPMNIQDWFLLGLTDLISLQSKGISRVFNTTVQKHQFFGAQLSLWSNSHIHNMTTGKTIALTIWTLSAK